MPGELRLISRHPADVVVETFFTASPGQTTGIQASDNPGQAFLRSGRVELFPRFIQAQTHPWHGQLPGRFPYPTDNRTLLVLRLHHV